MDSEFLLDLATIVTKLKMYPYFDICHYTLMCLQVKDDLVPLVGAAASSNQLAFARKHPFACWLSSMLLCFSAGILSSLFLGEPMIKPLLSHRDVATATLVWYFVFYSPFDLVYKLLRLTPIRLVVSLVKEVQRAHKILDGVNHVAHLYPDSYFLMVLIGTIKGGAVNNLFQRFVYYVVLEQNDMRFTPRGKPQNEFLCLSFTTKLSAAASAAFVASNLGLLPVSFVPSVVYLSVVVTFMLFRIAYVVAHVHDPLRPFENLACSILLGGMFDALRIATMHPTPAVGGASTGAPAEGGAQGHDATTNPSTASDSEGKKTK